MQIQELEAQRKDVDQQIKIQEVQGKLEKLKADVILTLEKAETEDVKNQVSVFTAQFDAIKQMAGAK